jgi:AraC-like DNA-binding protein
MACMIDYTSPHQDGGPASQYRELAPPPWLVTHLLCTWTQCISDGKMDYPHRVLPDGCVDIVWINNTAPIVAAPATQAFIAHLPPRAMLVGVRCRPGLAASLLGIPATELLNQEVQLRDMCARLAARLSSPVAEQPSVTGKLAAIEAALTTHLAEARPADAVVTAAIAWLAQHPSSRVHQLSRLLGLSSRQLQRRFSAAVGYGPKTFHRILRFQRVLALARKPQVCDGNLSWLALETGYADQAHMTREMQRLAGQQPTALLAKVDTTLGMSDLFKTTADLSNYPPH